MLRTLTNNITNGMEIVGVITREKSDYNSDFCDLSPICKEKNIDFIYTNNINDNSTIEYINSKKPDLIYCFGWSQLLSKEIISIPSKGTVGFHPTKLPQNRGRHPIIWTLVLGLKETASTFFLIDQEADRGDIISQELISVTKNDNARTLYDRILKIASDQLIEITYGFLENNIKRIVQDEQKSNIWRKRNKEDGKIDWRMSSENIYNLVRALTRPYVGAHFIFKGKEYKVWEVEVLENHFNNIEYGKIIKINKDKTFIIKTGDGAIKVKKYDDVNLKEGEYLL